MKVWAVRSYDCYTSQPRVLTISRSHRSYEHNTLGRIGLVDFALKMRER